jgi:hypothetical protein
MDEDLHTTKPPHMSGHGIGPLGCGDVGGEELVGIDPLLGSAACHSDNVSAGMPEPPDDSCPGTLGTPGNRGATTVE